MYSYFIYFSLILIGILCIIAIIIPIIFISYIAYITFFKLSFNEIDIYHKYGDFLQRFISKYINIDNYKIKFTNKELINKDKQYIYVFYPHGMYAFTQIIHLVHKNSELKPYFKNAVHSAHPMLFSMPFFREFGLLNKSIPVAREYLDHYLEEGKSLTINPGGIRDIKNCTYRNRNTDILYLNKRKGFIRIAKDNNVEIIPIYCWDEQNIIRHSNGFGWLNTLNRKYLGLGFDFNSLQGLSPANMISIIQTLFKDKKGTIAYVGKPINVNGTIDEIHTEFINQMKELFNIANKEHGNKKELIIE
jgi:2-acylglycerol O-acyltransferase 2